MRDREALVTQIEPLEARQLLAGTVDATVVGSVLRIEADAASNDFVISRVAGDLQLTSGSNPTTINVVGDLSAVSRIEINDLGGNDIVTLNQLDSLTRVVYRSTGGDKQIAVDNSHVDRLDINFTDGSSLNLSVSDATIDGNLMLIARNGSLTTSITGSSTIEGSVLQRVTTGDNHFAMSDTASVARSVRQTTIRGGDSSTRLSDQSDVGSVLLARNVTGRSDIRIADDATVGRFVGSGFTRQRNIEYVNRNGDSLRADVTVPRSAGLHPAVIAIHGGAWISGNKVTMNGEARELAQRGYVVMSIEYRLAPSNHFPDQVHDVKAAIAWLKANAAEYDVDPNQIGLWGFSAGAHLALLAGLTTLGDGLEDPNAPAGSPSTTVQAVVGAAPPTDFRNVDPNSTAFTFLFGGTRAEVPELYEQASAGTWASAWDPPVYMYMGENDNLVSRADAEQLVTDLENAGAEAELEIVPGKNHFTAKRDRTAIYNSLRFLDQQLKV